MDWRGPHHKIKSSGDQQEATLQLAWAETKIPFSIFAKMRKDRFFWQA
jgi:hypothetical protein